MNSLYLKLAKWFRSDSKALRFVAYFILRIFAHISYWIFLCPDQFRSIPDMLREMKRQNRNVTPFTKFDVAWEFIARGFMTYEYIAYHFEEKSSKERKTFFSEMDKFIFMNICNTKEDKSKLRNKRLSYEIFKTWYKRDQVIVKSLDDLNIYSDFISKHSRFFIKPFAGGGGVNSGWFDSTKFSSAEESLKDILKNGSFVLEEGVFQCDAMSKFNPDSINTLRIVTIKQGDKVSNWCSFIRTGRKGCPVDNGGRGGIIIGVDINTGEMNTNGVNEQGEIFETHPDSGVKFKGFKIPLWKESCEMAIEMMDAMPNMRCIGWDIALTDKGPVVIEANGQSALCGPQITQQKGLRKEYEEVLKTLK